MGCFWTKQIEEDIVPPPQNNPSFQTVLSFHELFEKQKKQINELYDLTENLNSELDTIKIGIESLGEQIKILTTLIDNTYEILGKKKPEIENDKTIFENIQKKQIIDKNEFYVIESDTYANTFYLLTKDKNECSCPGFTFSKNEIKTCKHIKEYKNKNNLLIFNETNKECSCENFKELNTCDHSIFFSVKESTTVETQEEKESTKVETQEENETFYIIESMNEVNTYYLLNMDITTCNCPAFVYSSANPKICKHIERYQSNKENINLPILCMQKETCTCNDFLYSSHEEENSYCVHIGYFL
jgi:hypothetical protein